MADGIELRPAAVIRLDAPQIQAHKLFVSEPMLPHCGLDLREWWLLPG